MKSGKKAVHTEGNVVSLIINNNGMIRDCNETGKWLFGLSPGKLFSRHISTLLPELAEIALIHNGQLNPRLRFLSRIGHQFKVVGKSGKCFASQIFIHDLSIPDMHLLRMVIYP